MCKYTSSCNSMLTVQKIIVLGDKNHFVIDGDRNILIDRIKDAVMSSDLPPEIKVKVYNLIQEASSGIDK